MKNKEKLFIVGHLKYGIIFTFVLMLLLYVQMCGPQEVQLANIFIASGLIGSGLFIGVILSFYGLICRIRKPQKAKCLINNGLFIAVSITVITLGYFLIGIL